MMEREFKPKQTPPSSRALDRHRNDVGAKREPKRLGFDASADEEPQICRGID